MNVYLCRIVLDACGCTLYKGETTLVLHYIYIQDYFLFQYFKLKFSEQGLARIFYQVENWLYASS